MRVILIGLLLLLSTATAAAQGDSLPVIHPDDVLLAAAQDVSVLPLLIFDDEQRQLQYFDPGVNQWMTYAYPEAMLEIESRYDIQPRSDGTYLINADGRGYVWNGTDDIWIFDPSDGQFTHPEARCGYVQALPGEGEWVVIEDIVTSLPHLCMTENGDLSPPIPAVEDRSCIAGDAFRKPPSVSPDGQHVLFFCGGTTPDAFVFDLDTRTIRHLGYGNDGGGRGFGENVRVRQWIDETRAVVHTYPSWNPPANMYYVADISEPGSFEFIVRGFYASPFFFEDPPRLEWSPCEFFGCTPAIATDQYREYDFETGVLTIHPSVEGVYGFSEVIPDGSSDRLFRSLNKTDNSSDFIAPSATLLRFNFDTQEVHEVYTGEIEWVDGISLDGRYAVLVVGHDDHVVTHLALVENQLQYKPDGNAAIEILDLQTHSIVYQAEGGPWIPDINDPNRELKLGVPLLLTWIDADTFLIRGVDERDDFVVTLGDDSIEEIRLDTFGGAPLSLDHNNILVEHEDGIGVYHIATDTTTPLIRESLLSDYDVRIQWLADTTLMIDVHDTANFDRHYAHWMVDI